MSEVTVTFRKENGPISKNTEGLEVALGQWCCDRWRDKTPVHVAHYFGLSHSEAVKVVYGAASKNTLNKLLHHKHGGFGLYVELVSRVTGTSLEDFIKQQAIEAARERIQWEERQQRLEALSARCAGLRKPDRASR